MPGHGAQKLAEQIKQIAASMLERRIKDPRLGFVTITDVKIGKDNKEAVLYYTVLGDDQARADTAAALDDAKGQVRTQVSRQLGMRFAPTIAFMPDVLPEATQHFEDLLAQARQADAEKAARAAGAQPAGDPDPYRVVGDAAEDEE